MKKTFRITLCLLLSVCTLTGVHTTVLAADLPDYTVLAPLPGTTKCGDNGGTTCTTNLQTYLPGVFNFSIGVAALLAFVMITFGGVTYLVSDTLSKKEDGRKYVTNAVVGFLMVVSAYVILHTINPKILNFDLTISRPLTDASFASVKPLEPLSQVELAADAQVRKQLTDAHIDINHEACTTDSITKGCTSLNGLPQTAVNGLISLKNDCPACQVTVSGGTEGGHATHGVGDPVVDLQPSDSLNKYLGYSSPNGNSSGHPTVVVKGNATYTYEDQGDNGRATAPHWHVVYH
jgi:hypothetical protein